MNNQKSIYETECSILSAILAGDMAYLDLLNASDFSTEVNRRIFETVLEIRREGVAADDVVLVTSRSGLPAIDVAKVYDHYPAISAEPTAQVLIDHTTARRITEIAQKMIVDCRESPHGAIDRAHEAILALSEKSGRSAPGCRTMSEIMGECIEDLERLAECGSLSGVPCGIPLVDSITFGWQKGDLVLVAARPSMGKTAFAVNNCAVHAATNGVPTAVFSLEMSSVRLAHRILSAVGSVNGKKFRSGHLELSEWDAVHRAASRLSSAPLWINDRPLGYRDIWRESRRLKKSGLGLVVVDYIGLIECDDRRKGESREREVAEISKAFKSMAKELEIPVMVLCQLNRKCEERPDKRPMLSDLRESGSLEQDADLILFIYRHERYVRRHDSLGHETPEYTACKGKSEIIIAKHRNGPVGTINLEWQSRFTRFVQTQVGGNNGI